MWKFYTKLTQILTKSWKTLTQNLIKRTNFVDISKTLNFYIKTET
jgi:hypothetical protein